MTASPPRLSRPILALTITSAVMVAAVWLATSHYAVITWRYASESQLPLITLEFGDGRCDLSILRHRSDQPRSADVSLAFLGFTFLKIHPAGIQIADLPNGFHFRRLPVSFHSIIAQDFTDLRNTQQTWFSVQFVTLESLLLFVLTLHVVLHFYRAALRTGATTCSSCGYNLTGNTSGRCPECGAPCREYSDADVQSSI